MKILKFGTITYDEETDSLSINDFQIEVDDEYSKQEMSDSNEQIVLKALVERLTKEIK